VEFENPAKAISCLQAAGINIIKIQLSSALEIPDVNAASIKHLTRFDEPVYLHQVVEQRGKSLTRYTDMKAAIRAFNHRHKSGATKSPSVLMEMSGDLDATARQLFESVSEPVPRPEPDSTWRVHFHVPVFIDQTEHFSTTQTHLSQILELQKMTGFCRHLEVETYTWDVLPETYKTQSVSQAIAREVDWVRERL